MFEATLRTFSIVVLGAIAIVGAVFGWRVLARNSDQQPEPPSPVTATPDQEGEAGYWTPERLKEAKPIEMPYAPELPPRTAIPDSPQPGPSQIGAGSAGSEDVAPDEENILIPGQSETNHGNKTSD